MPPSSEDAPPARWAAWLHALWGCRATLDWLERQDARPVLAGQDAAGSALYLPAGCGEALAFAAAAHAAAHRRFGGPPQPRTGLKPVQQALFEVLEDARVEGLALRELPGLRALWLPFHADDAPGGNGFDALLARLARVLLDPAWTDPHPWVVRACAASRRGDGGFALATPGDVRALASRLGNDIGQMRLPFNARTWRMHAAYRDDGSFLWEPQALAPASDTTLAAQAAAAGGTPRDAGAPAQAVAPPPASVVEPGAPGGEPPLRYPEWDERIGRYRPHWCEVHVRTAAPGPAPTLPPPPRATRRLARALADLRGGPSRAAGRASWGDDFHPAALLDARLQRLAGQSPDLHVYRRRIAPPRRLAVQLLLDTSASTADRCGDGRPLLAHMLEAALASVAALDAAGHACALAGFASRGRHRVEVQRLKQWHEPATAAAVVARCGGQCSSGSTRLGAAVRHAADQALARAEVAGRDPVVLVLSDGEAHDIDAPDPAYLRGDLRRAVAEAQAAGVAVRWLLVQPAASAIRGRPVAGSARLRHPAALPVLLPTLLAA